MPREHSCRSGRSFTRAGYYILGEQFETPEEVRIAADAGALGYLSIAAHGHADALAFTLTLGGRPFLVTSRGRRRPWS